ncbi:MAG: UDP-N-acetylmuramate dehydrogenase [bacterium]|nr:UDP-N-acetylmuramate dehydrogenase [bacterium]
MLTTKYRKLEKVFGSRAEKDVVLAPYTTFKIGGPADLFFVAKNTAELVGAVNAAKVSDVQYFVLGGGSNILVSDAGFRGLVIKNEAQNCELTEGGLIRVDSGYPLQKFIDWTFDQGLVGLEWFGGIPGTIGGAIYNNIHGKDQLFNGRVVRVIMLKEDETVKTEPVSHLKSAYDYTILKEIKEVILEAFLRLESGDVEQARKIRLDWWQEKKKFQPQTNCAGCPFKNISEADQKRLEYPTRSTGYLIDRGLGLKGLQIGGAKVCETHANFIVNAGGATALDVVALIEKIKAEAKEKLGVKLELEIELIGF